MKSSLPALTRIKKFNIDEQRKLLLEQQQKEKDLLDRLKDLINRFEEEKLFARGHSNIGDFGLYVKKFLAEREDLEQKLCQIRQQISATRDRIADLFKEQKTYEIIEQQRQKTAEKQEDAREQKMLDEIGTNSYIKHQSQ